MLRSWINGLGRYRLLAVGVLDVLRTYIAEGSWARYAHRAGLRQKLWFSEAQSMSWGAFYLGSKHDSWGTPYAWRRSHRPLQRSERG